MTLITILTARKAREWAFIGRCQHLTRHTKPITSLNVDSLQSRGTEIQAAFSLVIGGARIICVKQITHKTNNL